MPIDVPIAADPFTVTFRGVRGSLPCPGKSTARYGGNTACVELRAGRDLLILDAGTGIRALGSELVAHSRSEPIHATLLISHTHWDHIQGLPFFSPAFAPENNIRVLAACGRRQSLQHGLQHQMNPVNFPISLDQLRGLKEIGELPSNDTHIGPFAVRTIGLNHPGGCSGFRIDTPSGSIAYLPDHEPFNAGTIEAAELVNFVRGANLLILDTQYSDNEYPAHCGWGHGCPKQSVALALEAHVHELALFHHDPSHTDEQMDRLLATARKTAQGTGLHIIAAREQWTMPVGSANLSLVGASSAAGFAIRPRSR